MLGEDVYGGPNDALAAATLEACLAVNAPLLHRVVTKKPLGVLKYAMTLDGKIATAQVGALAAAGRVAERRRLQLQPLVMLAFGHLGAGQLRLAGARPPTQGPGLSHGLQGHSAWVSSPESRQRVFEVRARSDAVIVGGQTVRRDNPQLTTRREGGHQPARIVMSRTLDLPEVRLVGFRYLGCCCWWG